VNPFIRFIKSGKPPKSSAERAAALLQARNVILTTSPELQPTMPLRELECKVSEIRAAAEKADSMEARKTNLPTNKMNPTEEAKFQNRNELKAQLAAANERLAQLKAELKALQSRRGHSAATSRQAAKPAAPQSTCPHEALLRKFSAMSGMEATAYFRSNKSAILTAQGIVNERDSINQ
jgi:hypothetical protein